MVNLKSFKNLRTVGVFILYKNTFAFMIGPNKSLDKLGIVRFGGHIEEKESAIECITREIEEETSSEVEIVNSPITYYKNDWDSGECIKTNDSLPFSKRPVIICGDDNRSTIIFLSYAKKELIPSAETNGIIYLNKNYVKRVCNSSVLLKDFIQAGGKIVEQRKLDPNLEMYAGPHLRFLNYLINANEHLINDFMNNEHLL